MNDDHATRRPRGFAATAAASQSNSMMRGGKKEREKEKERTKLRERHRRAITSRMLSGLRQHGNYPLPARADMNDVLAALARQAGWTVDPDGSTYRSSTPPQYFKYLGKNDIIFVYAKGAFSVRPAGSSLSNCSLRKCTANASLDCQPSIFKFDENLSPASLDSIIVSERDTNSEKYTSASPDNSSECLGNDQLMHVIGSNEHGNDFAGSPYVPLFVSLAKGVINNFCQLVNPEGIRQELRHLKSLQVDGVVVDCWWGIVEGWTPQKYEWSGYRELFTIVRELQLKLQVALIFNECGGVESSSVMVSLPHWVMELGKENPDIFFTDREGRRNTQSLSCGVDKERVLKGRTGLEVYFDFMRSFRGEFDDLFAEGLISAVQIGLGASGELKYPSFSERMGWRYPGIGEFQCYDKYSLQNLQKAATLRGHSFWGRVPDNAGQYNSRPHETGFFCERGDYDSYYGRFFLRWYSQTLLDHADNVLSFATLVFEDITLVVKIPQVYWWYKTPSHAAELTAGYYNSTNQDGYSLLFEVLKKHSVATKFVFSELQIPCQDGALADPEGLSWQVINSAWDRGLSVAGQNANPCCDREAFLSIVETAKPRNHPDQCHFLFFVYRQVSSPLKQGTTCFSDLDYFVKCMHGELEPDV